MTAMTQLAKTHCPYGHEYDEGNTYLTPRGHRVCKTCRRGRQEEIRRAEGKDRRGEARFCRNGLHELTPENTITWKNKPRQCRACNEAAKALRNYGITYDELQALRDEAQGLCQACGESEIRTRPNGGLAPLHIDHNHLTDRVRGLICMRCNIALGHVRDDIEVLKKLISYLERTS